MAYDNPGMGGEDAGAALESGGMHDESMHEEGMDHKMGSIFLSPSMLPEGMKVNPGDILEFSVVGTDKDGDVEVIYNTGKEEKDGKDESGMDEWEHDFKEHMSARNPEEGTG